jgi:pimeloyl-ACP methyl ester carboxylesterase
MVPTAGDVVVAVHDLGGDGPPLLILHATGFHGRCYEPVADRLAEHFHVHAPDLRGHGDTITPAGADLHWSNMASDTLAVVDHLGLDDSVYFAGHSMGGATVIMSELRRPGLVRAAWLYEPIIFPAEPLAGAISRANPLAELARRRREHFVSRDEAYERYASKPPFSHVDPAALRAYVDHGFRDSPEGVTLKCRGESEASVFEGVDTSVFERLGEVEAPIVVVGSGDGEGPSQLAPSIAENLRNGRADGWPDRSHFGPFEDPGRTAEAIIEALT